MRRPITAAIASSSTAPTRCSETSMDALIAFLSILAALAVGAISPGPSFVFVVRTSLAQSRRDGIAAALGMGVGGVIFAALALLGLQGVLTKIVWLYAAPRLAGGFYLLTSRFASGMALLRRSTLPTALSITPPLRSNPSGWGS